MDQQPDKLRISESRLVTQRADLLQRQQSFSLASAGAIGGVEIINDSAATNLELVATSLMAFEEKVIWVVEANSQNPDFGLLCDAVGEKVKTIVALGPQVDFLHDALYPVINFFLSAESWEEAVEMSLMVAKPGDTVLFSPGCRPSEPFENFRKRGEYFNRLIEIKRNFNS